MAEDWVFNFSQGLYHWLFILRPFRAGTIFNKIIESGITNLAVHITPFQGWDCFYVGDLKPSFRALK